MHDLIWIGNTLYPRWLVLLAGAAAFLAVFGPFVYLTKD